MNPFFKKEILGFKQSNSILAGIIGINIVLFFIFIFSKHYPPLLMILHMLSLLVLWGLVFYGTGILAMLQTRWKELLLIFGLILIAFFVRMYRVEEITPGMYGDEVSVASRGLELQALPDWLPFEGTYPVYYSHPAPLLYLTADSVDILGHTKTAIRSPSIIFGALSIGVFYILLRLFFPIPISIAGGILMIFQYSDVILSRLAYESIPSLFFQILCAIFLVLYARTKNNRYLLGLALAIGGGLYTYYNFRTFALFVYLLALLLILWKKWRSNLINSIIFTVMVFVASMPFLSTAIIDPHGFWGRITDISIFGRGYSLPEFFKELWANMYRTAILPFYSNPNPSPTSPPLSGDPNPDKNPSNMSMFDPITTLLAIAGFVYFFRKRRSVFWIMLILLIPAYVSDIFSTEVIPMFHYYGLGHPNALRVSGFIPIILFAATAGIWWGYTKWGKNKPAEALTVLTILIVGVSVWNWHWYFDQEQLSPEFYIYNYQFNNEEDFQIADYLNSVQTTNVSMTKDLAKNYIVQFFLTKPKQISSFDLTNTASAVKTINNSDITIIDVNQKSVPILNDLGNMQNTGLTVQIIRNPLNQPVAAIFEKTGLPF